MFCASSGSISVSGTCISTTALLPAATFRVTETLPVASIHSDAENLYSNRLSERAWLVGLSTSTKTFTVRAPAFGAFTPNTVIFGVLLEHASKLKHRTRRVSVCSLRYVTVLTELEYCHLYANHKLLE